MSSLRKDIENFEYRKGHYLPEHRWCALYDLETQKKFFEEKDKKVRERYKLGRVQSDPETTGQHGTML